MNKIPTSKIFRQGVLSSRKLYIDFSFQFLSKNGRSV
ncbi:unnamed protein product [Amoebophrya sp. A25]|nr:unnamed protein product [Amoebophrya sp. A25]|eukprot:GSA25T00022824001.1